LLAGGAATLMTVMPLAIAKNVLRGAVGTTEELPSSSMILVHFAESDCRRAQEESAKTC